MLKTTYTFCKSQVLNFQDFLKRFVKHSHYSKLSYILSLPLSPSLFPSLFSLCLSFLPSLPPSFSSLLYSLLSLLSLSLARLCSVRDLSSLTRDQTHAPCRESRSLNHCPTREGPPQLSDCDRRGRSPGR